MQFGTFLHLSQNRYTTSQKKHTTLFSQGATAWNQGNLGNLDGAGTPGGTHGAPTPEGNARRTNGARTDCARVSCYWLLPFQQLVFGFTSVPVAVCAPVLVMLND